MENELSHREPYVSLLERLHAEAAAGITSVVTEAEALEFRRDQYGLSAKDFSAVLGLGASHYSEVIHGKRRLPIRSVAKAIAVGVPSQPLLSGR
jgi:antitoxin component HigA of HigAB toxin-antitoxin module